MLEVKCHRGGGAWQLLGVDSDSCQGQSSEGESASSDPPRCDSFESDLVDAVNDDAREEHDLSCPDGDGAEVEEHGADGHGRTAGGVQAPHGVGSRKYLSATKNRPLGYPGKTGYHTAT